MSNSSSIELINAVMSPRLNDGDIAGVCAIQALTDSQSKTGAESCRELLFCACIEAEATTICKALLKQSN